MTAEIIDHPKVKRMVTDRAVAEALRDFTDGFLAAIARAEEGLALIDTDDLQPASKHMVGRFTEHLEDLRLWAERVTVTRNLARFQAHVLERDGQ